VEDARDIIGQIVLVKLATNEGLEFGGIPSDGPFFCKAVAVDEVGVWVENRHFATIEVRSASGRYIPKARQKLERHVVNLLLPWRIIQTIIKFEDERGAEIKAEMLGEEKSQGPRVGFVK
jgi:hypothetical protein